MLACLSQSLFYCCEETHGKLQEKTFDWGLACSFREVVHEHHGRECGSKHAGMVLEQELSSYILF